jgi:hypothetical protein
MQVIREFGPKEADQSARQEEKQLEHRTSTDRGILMSISSTKIRLIPSASTANLTQLKSSKEKTTVKTFSRKNLNMTRNCD